MYQKILVPLDGSKLAECVLPHVEVIAKGCGNPTIVYLRVVEPFNFGAGGGEWVPSSEQLAKFESQSREEAQSYLAQIAGQYRGLNIKSAVVSGKSADAIAEYAGKNAVDLIVIATHGRSGMSRWVWGSVADRILRSSCVPVLMVRAPGCVSGI
ncbi:MAG: universal stress protein [Dehalococcoidales bacterium]|nr:universal stress protein [Dehalococcoidales bacterium]